MSPSKTRKQATAMRIAAHGKGNIGIPVGVAKEFVAADKRAGKFGAKKKGKRKS